jgi:hypothetical protein
VGGGTYHLHSPQSHHKTDEVRGAALGTSFDSVNFVAPTHLNSLKTDSIIVAPNIAVVAPLNTQYSSAIESFKAFSTTPRVAGRKALSVTTGGDIESQLHEEDSDDSFGDEGGVVSIRRPSEVSTVPAVRGGANVSAASAVMSALSSMDASQSPHFGKMAVSSAASNTSAKLRMDFLVSEEALGSELLQKREAMLNNMASRLNAVKTAGVGESLTKASLETNSEFSKPPLNSSSSTKPTEIGVMSFGNVINSGGGNISSVKPSVNSISINTTKASGVGVLKMQQSPHNNSSNNKSHPNTVRRAEEITREYSRTTKENQAANERKKAQAQSKVAERLSQKKK